ncbi:MAG: hypothetical protein KatS3mg087_1494 [Patescibacteria group bacterium]|nr:MAG: hypothetical protein KatS3mg087_1494 [Patescibacteria group bacterium]
MNYITSELQKAILKSIQDVQAASEVSSFLDEIEASTYKTDSDATALVKRLLKYCYPLSELMSGRPKQVIRDICQEAQSMLKNCDRIKIEMAYIPSRDFASGLYDIFQSLGYSLFLLDFIVTPDIGTGAHFYHKGNFIDVSFVNIIKEKMKGTNLGIA